VYHSFVLLFVFFASLEKYTFRLKFSEFRQPDQHVQLHQPPAGGAVASLSKLQAIDGRRRRGRLTRAVHRVQHLGPILQSSISAGSFLDNFFGKFPPENNRQKFIRYLRTIIVDFKVLNVNPNTQLLQT
jgi:hypothetical protein